MKKIVFIFIITLVIAGCSSDDKEPLLENTVSYAFGLSHKLQEYNVEKKFSDNSQVFIGTYGDSLIFFSGQLKESSEIGIVIFNTKTKKLLVDIVPNKDSQIVIDKPYGEKEILLIKAYSPNAFLDNGSIFISLRPIITKNESTKYGDLSLLCFIQDTKLKNKTIHYYSSGYSYSPRARQWSDSFLIQLSNTNADPSLKTNEVSLYNSLGEKILEVIYPNTDDIFECEIINDFEGISTEYGITVLYEYAFSITRFKLDEENSIWHNSFDLSELDRPRIDNTKILSKSESFYIYEISYTEYSGNKGIITLKVDIEKGDINSL